MMCIVNSIRFITNLLIIIIVIHVEPSGINHKTLIIIIFLLFDQIKFLSFYLFIFFSISEIENLKSSMHVCTILHFFRFLVSQA